MLGAIALDQLQQAGCIGLAQTKVQRKQSLVDLAVEGIKTGVVDAFLIVSVEETCRQVEKVQGQSTVSLLSLSFVLLLINPAHLLERLDVIHIVAVPEVVYSQYRSITHCLSQEDRHRLQHQDRKSVV